MESYGFLSLLPPVIAIVLAIRTKQVHISLLFGIWLGWIIISGFNPIRGSFDTIQALVDVFQDAGNTRTIMFCALVGALIIFVQRSGGVEGFIRHVNRLLEHYERKRSGSNRTVIQLLAWLTGLAPHIVATPGATRVESVHSAVAATRGAGGGARSTGRRGGSGVKFSCGSPMARSSGRGTGAGAASGGASGRSTSARRPRRSVICALATVVAGWRPGVETGSSEKAVGLPPSV